MEELWMAREIRHFFGDVAIKDGKIAAIGRIQSEAKKRNRCNWHDRCARIHRCSHPCGELAEMPLAENFVRMGVTTVVVGIRAARPWMWRGFFKRLKQTNIAVNVATLIGHNSVRRKAMGGAFDRPPSSEEMEKMEKLVEQAMKDGAVGFLTGLIYLPGVFAKTDELIPLARIAGRYDGIYTSHMRHEDTQIYEALDEVFRICKEAYVRRSSISSFQARTAWDKLTVCLRILKRPELPGWT